MDLKDEIKDQCLALSMEVLTNKALMVELGLIVDVAHHRDLILLMGHRTDCRLQVVLMLVHKGKALGNRLEDHHRHLTAPLISVMILIV